MSILSGFFKTKKYRKTDDGYRLQSEWTSADTVEMNDGVILTDRLTWKEIGGTSYAGKNTLDISALNANEFYIKVNLSHNILDNNDIVCPIFIPMFALQHEQHFRSGYSFNSGNCGVASFLCSTQSIGLDSVYLNGKDITSEVEWSVYYR